jgi:tRNA(fMet)-specific endonuclease VapC
VVTATEPMATTLIAVEEEMRGWLSLIHRQRGVENQISGYNRLANLIEFFREWSIVRFDAQCATEYRRLQRLKIRIGSMDLKIAAIALVHDALLLSANLSDFRKVPGLRVEDWLTTGFP